MIFESPSLQIFIYYHFHSESLPSRTQRIFLLSLRIIISQLADSAFRDGERRLEDRVPSKRASTAIVQNILGAQIRFAKVPAQCALFLFFRAHQYSTY
jgi:hypothetical protein